MLVKESINFERGQDPKETMGIGRKLAQLANKTGMTPSELRMTKSRMNNLFSGGEIEFKNFVFWLKRWKEKPEDHSININSSVHDDIIWAYKNPKDAFELINLDISQMYEDTHNFERGLDPRQALNVGKAHMIQQWLDSAGFGIKDFKIDDDFAITLFKSWTMISEPDLFPGGKLPEYIEFSATKDFDVDDCGIVSLERFPLLVSGYFSCQMNKITSLEGFPIIIDGSVYVMNNKKKFTEQDIRQKCNVAGSIEADDSNI